MQGNPETALDRSPGAGVATPRVLAVTAVGKDSPGLVATVAEALHDAGCNIQDSAMTRLGGEFAMIVIAQVPAGLGAADLEERLRAGPHPLTMSVRELGPGEVERRPRAGKPYLVSVYGEDRAGILARVARLLAARGVLIDDVSTRVTPGSGSGRPLAAMVLEVELPPGTSADALQQELAAAVGEMGLDATLHPAEPTEI